MHQRLRHDMSLFAVRACRECTGPEFKIRYTTLSAVISGVVRGLYQQKPTTTAVVPETPIVVVAVARCCRLRTKQANMTTKGTDLNRLRRTGDPPFAWSMSHRTSLQAIPVHRVPVHSADLSIDDPREAHDAPKCLMDLRSITGQ